MITIGLDMSLSGTGLCVLCDGAVSLLRTIRAEGKNQHQRRQSIIARVFDVMAERPAMVCIEQALLHAKHMQGATQQIALTECMGDEAVDRGLPLMRIAQSTLKKFATGTGHAKKPQMIAAAQVEGAAPGDDNQADAFWLARIGESICRVRAGEVMNGPRLEIIDAILKRGW